MVSIDVIGVFDVSLVVIEICSFWFESTDTNISSSNSSSFGSLTIVVVNVVKKDGFDDVVMVAVGTEDVLNNVVVGVSCVVIDMYSFWFESSDTNISSSNSSSFGSLIIVVVNCVKAVGFDEVFMDDVVDLFFVVAAVDEIIDFVVVVVVVVVGVGDNVVLMLGVEDLLMVVFLVEGVVGVVTVEVDLPTESDKGLDFFKRSESNGMYSTTGSSWISSIFTGNSSST